MAVLGCRTLAEHHGSSRDTTRHRRRPRTAWGDPDFQGVWRYEAAIPLERPEQFEGRASLTDQEVAERQQMEKEQAAKTTRPVVEGAAVGRRSVPSHRFAGTIQQLLAGPRTTTTGVQTDVADRGSI